MRQGPSFAEITTPHLRELHEFHIGGFLSFRLRASFLSPKNHTSEEVFFWVAQRFTAAMTASFSVTALSRCGPVRKILSPTYEPACCPLNEIT
jgi:hypothetical protein